MCRNIICSECVYQRIEEELGVNAASTIKSYYDQWRHSCPNEDVLSLGTMIPMFLNLLQFELHYYFLFVISLNFDPLTLSEWGFQ